MTSRRRLVTVVQKRVLNDAKHPHHERITRLFQVVEVRPAETEQSSNDDPRVLASELPQQSPKVCPLHFVQIRSAVRTGAVGAGHHRAPFRPQTAYVIDESISPYFM